MIAPSRLLLWLTAITLLPACALPAFLPHGARYIALCAGVICFVGLADLMISRRRLAGFRVVLPSAIRAVLHEEVTFAVELHRDISARSVPRRMRLAIALPEEIEPIRDDVFVHVPAAQQGVKTEFSGRPRERGKFAVERAFLGSASCLGLWQLRRTVLVQSTFLVEPALSQISREAAKLLAGHQHGGQRIVARNGRGREFEQLREYVPSDDFGNIDWKATARRHTPIVREYQVERTQDVYACIDFSRLSGRSVVRKDENRATILDEYIRSTLMLYSAVRRTGDRFGFATFSDHVELFVKATHAAELDRVFRKALYPLRPALTTPAFDEICSLLRTRVRRRALIVFFTNLAEPQLSDAFFEASRVLVRQHLVVAACPADLHTQPLFADSKLDNIDDIYGKLAGHLLWKKLEQVRLRLSRVGVRMQAVAPGRLGLTAATQYLDIKERQLL